MNRYVKISAALAAFALLLVVMGLSTQGAVDAQVAPGTIVFANTSDATDKYVCSSCLGNLNQFTVAIQGDGAGILKATNLDVARVNLVNPKTIARNTPIFVVQQGSEDENPGDLAAAELRGFNGNRIELEFTPEGGGGFATYATVIVDNVDPTLITQSPSTPLIVKGSTAVTFQAEITDGGSGYTSTVGAASGIEGRTGTSGPLGEGGGATPAGGVRLVVAGNIVGLDKTNFEAIDGGWNVWATINSSAILNIGPNAPWYFETRDRAGNTRRSGGSVALKPSAASNTSITDADYKGNLRVTAFDGSVIKVTRGSNTITLSITEFAGGTGVFTVTEPSPVPVPFDTVPVTTKDKFEIVGTNLVTVDNKAPRIESGGTTTGIAYNSSTRMEARGLKGKANSIQIKFADDGKYGLERLEANTTNPDPDKAGSGLEASSVVPGAFTVSGNTVVSARPVGNTVYLTLSDNLGPDEKPKVTIASGQIADKAGNAFGGDTVTAADGLGPNLSLSKSGDLSDEDVTVTITTDEQLSSPPTVTLGRVVNASGDVVNRGDQECIYDEVVDPTPENEVDDSRPLFIGPTSLDADDAVICANKDGYAQDIAPSNVEGQPEGLTTTRQTEALAYTYKVVATTVNPTAPIAAIGGKYNVYVEGVDTQDAENNKSKVGSSSGANNVGAFTFQLDTELNGNVDPIVKVGESVAVDADGDVPKVEAIDNLIVTVDFADESGEYPGDSYRTVDLTLAELTISFKDGQSEKTTFNLTTDVNSPDNIQFTIALLNPKVGSYSLKVQATDSAGNASDTSGHVSKWNVVSAKPVPIKLQPGWNMISLPFQPGNPAINSVIPSTHPADIVMTFDGPTQTWLVSRRDAESGLFTGDIAVMTASTAYFVRTTNFQELSILRPPIATNAAPPPQIPALAVVKGWNLIPIVSNASPLPDEIPADEYFGTLANSGNSGWLKAITFNTLARTWEDVTPGEKVSVTAEDGTITLEPATVKRGKGYWLYATGDGVIIP